MYLKFTVAGPLEDLVKAVWPNASADELISDYENVYEWVWLRLPVTGIRLNISREHQWSEETRICPIYVSAFEIDRDKFVANIPEDVIERIHGTHKCRIEVFSGNPNVDTEDGVPVRILEAIT